MNKFELSQVTIEFRKQCSRWLNENSHVIAGVSGGPDSMALLYLFNRVGISVTAVHCNYGLRGKSSDLDQQLVEEMCSLWNIECVSVRFEKKEFEVKNFQNQARGRRYQVFWDLKKELNADVIATAHHGDDQVETILQKMLRGSGLSAWKGMQVSDGEIFRPLLSISKQEIIRFVQEFNVPYRIDGSNEESTYARNFLRNTWFPELDRLFPGWKKNLLKVTDRAREFEAMAGEILNGISEHPERLNRARFLALDKTIRPVVLHQFLENSGFDVSVSSGFLADSEALDKLQTGAEVQVSDSYSLKRDRDHFLLTSKNSAKEIRQKLYKNDLGEPVTIEEVTFLVKTFDGNFTPEYLHLDMEKISFPIIIRRWQSGDEIDPLGMKGKQSVSDHLTNRKISSSKKTNAKIVESFDGNISAVIFPHQTKDGQIGTVSESVRCDRHTETVLIIRKT